MLNRGHFKKDKLVKNILETPIDSIVGKLTGKPKWDSHTFFFRSGKDKLK